MAFRQTLCVRLGLLAGLLPSFLSIGGCTVFSSAPLWEVAKVAGMAASNSLGQSKAINTIYLPHEPVKQVCIEFNRDSQVADFIPALQAELNARAVRSRVYEPGVVLDTCPVWLRYQAYMQWAQPPLSDKYKSYMTAATITLQSDDGRIYASSSYETNDNFGVAKWTSTRSKLAPVVAAVMTGIE